MSRVHIHIVSYNEKIMLPFTLQHYRKMFKDVAFIVHDNNSNDGSAEYAKMEGCTVIPFTTEGMNDTVQSQIKSTAAMSESITSACDWVLLIDADEECFINDSDLNELERTDINAVEFQGWNIFDQVKSPFDITEPKGVLCSGYSKPVLLRTGVFQGVTFAAGAHSAIITPKEGIELKWSRDKYKLLHYKHWSCDYNIMRSEELAKRQSEDNLQHNHSFHFAFARDIHESFFNSNFEQRVTIVDPRI